MEIQDMQKIMESMMKGCFKDMTGASDMKRRMEECCEHMSTGSGKQSNGMDFTACMRFCQPHAKPDMRKTGG